MQRRNHLMVRVKVRREKPEQGHFGGLLQRTLESKQITMVELSKQADITYEHARKLVNSLAYPSKYLAEKLCKLLEMNHQEVADAIMADKMKRSYGDAATLRMANKPPRVEAIERYLSNLTPEQFDTVKDLLRVMDSKNRRPSN